jgi:hypothetical protein
LEAVVRPKALEEHTAVAVEADQMVAGLALLVS